MLVPYKFNFSNKFCNDSDRSYDVRSREYIRVPLYSVVHELYADMFKKILNNAPKETL